MVPVKKNLVPESKYKIKCPYTMVPEELAIHNTANDASAENEVKYMIRNDKKTSYHYAVDDKCIIQAIPENRNAFHAGDGSKGRGNRKALSIEICYSKSGGTRFTKAEKNAAELAASILTKYGWGIEKLKKHQDYSGKYCPHRTLDLGWERFVNMVKAYMNKSQFADLAKDHWGYNAALDLFKRGIVNGIGDNKINPSANTTRAEVAAMIYRTVALLVPQLKQEPVAKFEDVPEDHWAFTAIDTVKNLGIVDGWKTRTFRPNDAASRAEVAVMIRNAINYFNTYTVKYDKPAFADVDDKHWAYKHIYDLYNMGIVNGYTNDTFMPNKTISRIEVIALISRMITFLGR